MQNHKGFRRIICVTILCALLMVSMGRATRVSAVGTTAAIAGTAFILTGAVYLSYVALTQGEMVLPAADEMHNWLGSIGRKVSQYPSGAAAYQDIYQGLLRDPAANVIDGVWTWTQDRIKSFINDFSDTRIISDILGYEYTVDTSTTPLNGYDYSFEFVTPNPVVKAYNGITVNQPLATSWPDAYFYDGPGIVSTNSANTYAVIEHLNTSVQLRNYKKTNGKYIVQYLNNGIWQTYNVSTPFGGYLGQGRYFVYNFVINGYNSANYPFTISLGSEYDYPILTDSVIHDEATDSDLPMVVPNGYHLPSWVDPDNENRPIIPWVPIPDIPTGIPTPPGYTGPPQWGFPLAEILDLLEELAEGLIKIDAIARLINEFAGQHGDNYYLEYNDGDTNYYTYYQPTIFDNDTEYVTYNIDVSEQQDVVPVDLNTISLYTHNNYLDDVKDAARSFGSAIGEYVAFWHNCDPVVTYTILGSFVLILLGAFIGKWGHS